MITQNDIEEFRQINQDAIDRERLEIERERLRIQKIQTLIQIAQYQQAKRSNRSWYENIWDW